MVRSFISGTSFTCCGDGRCIDQLVVTFIEDAGEIVLQSQPGNSFEHAGVIITPVGLCGVLRICPGSGCDAARELPRRSGKS